MRRLTGEMRSHSREVRWVVVAWSLLWILTVATWLYDPAGNSFGMPFPVFFLHLVGFPLVVGAVVSRWRLNSGLAGLIVSEGNLALNLVWSGVLALLGRIDPAGSMSVAEGLVEVLEFVLLMGLAGFLAGALGGFLGRVIRGHLGR